MSVTATPSREEPFQRHGRPTRRCRVPALIALINTLAAEHNQLFIQPIDPASGEKLLRAHLASIATSGNETVLVARDREQLVGLITGMRGDHPARRGVVEIGIGVRASHRSQGVGFSLMMALSSAGHAKPAVTACRCASSRATRRRSPFIARRVSLSKACSKRRPSSTVSASTNCKWAKRSAPSAHAEILPIRKNRCGRFCRVIGSACQNLWFPDVHHVAHGLRYWSRRPISVLQSFTSPCAQVEFLALVTPASRLSPNPRPVLHSAHDRRRAAPCPPHLLAGAGHRLAAVARGLRDAAWLGRRRHQWR